MKSSTANFDAPPLREAPAAHQTDKPQARDTKLLPGPTNELPARQPLKYKDDLDEFDGSNN